MSCPVAAFCFSQSLLGPLARADVVEENRDLPLLCRTVAEGVDVVEPGGIQVSGLVLEAGGLAGLGNASVDLEPVFFMARIQLADGATLGPDEPGLRDEGRVRLHEPVVHRAAALVEEHLDDAKAFVDGVEQNPVALFALLQRLRHRFRTRVVERHRIPHVSRCGDSRSSRPPQLVRGVGRRLPALPWVERRSLHRSAHAASPCARATRARHLTIRPDATRDAES